MNLTLRDLSKLCTHYVPRAARHPGSFRGYAGRPRPTWWPSHELGHLLTVPRRQVSMPLFGLDETLSLGRPDDVRLAATYELAAMYVSARLLEACGRAEISDEEFTEGNGAAIQQVGDERAAMRMVSRRKLWNLPRTFRGLEALIRKRLALPRTYQFAT